MSTSTDEITKTPKSKNRKPKRYSTPVEKEIMVGNLRLAVEYYGKDYMRKIFKVTKRSMLHTYSRH